VFSVIVSQDDVARGKPDPEPYLRAADLLQVAGTELAVLEDTDVGVESAKGAGAYVVGLTRTLGAARMAAADELVSRIDVALVERLLCS
jgi:sugar-phosphatase